LYHEQQTSPPITLIMDLPWNDTPVLVDGRPTDATQHHQIISYLNYYVLKYPLLSTPNSPRTHVLSFTLSCFRINHNHTPTIPSFPILRTRLALPLVPPIPHLLSILHTTLMIKAVLALLHYPQSATPLRSSTQQIEDEGGNKPCSHKPTSPPLAPALHT
jgi:hypothetical protein